MTVNEKIAVLRGEMAKANVDALVIPTSDPHMSEYIPARSFPDLPVLLVRW